MVLSSCATKKFPQREKGSLKDGKSARSSNLNVHIAAATTSSWHLPIQTSFTAVLGALDVKGSRSISQINQPLTRIQAGMTTFMAINLGKDMKLRKKEKQALVSERKKLARQKAEEAIKELKEQKLELERSFEFGLRQQAKRMERLLRSLEVAENQADWLVREVRKIVNWKLKLN